MSYTWTFTVDSVAATPTLSFGVSFYANGTKYASTNLTVQALPSNDGTGILTSVTPLALNYINSNVIAWEKDLDSTAITATLASAVSTLSSSPVTITPTPP